MQRLCARLYCWEVFVLCRAWLRPRKAHPQPPTLLTVSEHPRSPTYRRQQCLFGKAGRWDFELACKNGRHQWHALKDRISAGLTSTHKTQISSFFLPFSHTCTDTDTDTDTHTHTHTRARTQQLLNNKFPMSSGITQPHVIRQL